MKKYTEKKMLILCISLVAAGSVAGCAHVEKSPPERNTGYMFIHKPLPEASRKVDEARAAGKDKDCPEEFKAAKDTVDKAYAVYIACHTQEAIAMSQDGINKLNGLCPPKKVEPPSPPPAPVVTTPPVPPAPTAAISINPNSIVRGESATAIWTSRNATGCTIQPEIGSVAPQGSRKITPADNASYTLVCSGPGGSADSAASIAVAEPAPVEKPVPPAKLCNPTVLDVHFDVNKYDIKPQYHNELKKLADFLAEFPKAKGVIEGHTDSDGSAKSNEVLSRNRAEAIRNYLIKNFGIAPERIKAEGYGESRPIADNKTASGKQKNRRIEANFKCNGD